MDQPSDPEKLLRKRVLMAKAVNELSEAYQDYFTYFGLAGLRDRLNDEDTGIALQAAWEVHKKAATRAVPDPYRVDDVYDRAELESFVAFLKDRTRAPLPEWWAEAVVDVDLFPGQHHAFISRPRSAVPKLRTSRAGCLVPQGAELELDGDVLVYTFGDRALRFHKKTCGYFVDDCVLLGLIDGVRSVIAVCSSEAGFPGTLFGFEGNGGKPTWTSPIWAAGRRILMGRGSHQVELRKTGGVVYVFGVDSHGAYLEAFNITTGECALRFCTCYWFNHSEAWGLK
jgi:hypothetical protein